jgi:ubiquinone/menaquinone biosynthesis C-methylase UbiE
LSSRQSKSEHEEYLARGFRDVDAADAGKMAFCLKYLDSLPQFQQYKKLILEMMNPQAGSVIADLGCGLGFDVRRLAGLVGPEGRAIGVDSSRNLLVSARSASGAFPNAEFLQADIRKLPFRDGYLNSCKIDRVLQHVAQPEAVLREMYRTVSPGGIVACAEPDWGTFRIDDGHSTIAAQIGRSWAASFQNPGIGRELRQLLSEAGFLGVQVKEQLLSTDTFESSDAVFDIAQSAMRLAANTGSSEPADWLKSLRDHGDPIRCSVTIVINSARRGLRAPA